MKTNILKSERVKCDLTQRDIAISLGIDPTSYSKKENGLIEFKPSEIKLLKHFLKLSPEKIDEIFFDYELELISSRETINQI